ncbi:hypothetical protein ACMTAS_0021 [Thermotoga neapolitana DSM 4359]|uniref:NADPH-dependent FMN reductase n=1 Tax=Thermotoga neapolitana (strain ATCC 49049 / DSM 4359 / NBRC 107923 / NS-E) TaxID=309803 RepID=B9K7B6_THENN|nr:NADPH-dependent FMN reductase [Thermotoga neapolitana DSM 4359]KFZ22033.1 NADPH-dependent FMN reductase [Thermotoga neapolitana LA10]MDK2786447.1 hypothetical protein [Thermotoga sp.]MDK2949756.1 hypothetical protein [Thermotoga sp.]
MEKVGIIGGNGLNEPGAVLKRTDLLKKAEEIGEKFLG